MYYYRGNLISALSTKQHWAQLRVLCARARSEPQPPAAAPGSPALRVRVLSSRALLEPGGAGAVSPGQDGGAVLHTLVAGGCGDSSAAGCSGERGPAVKGGGGGDIAGPQVEHYSLHAFPGSSRPRGAADIETRCQPHR